MTSTSSLSGKRVLVTGGSRGIGAAMPLTAEGRTRGGRRLRVLRTDPL